MPSSAVRDTTLQAPCAASAAAHPVPDRQGGSLFAADPDLRALLPLYLPPDLFNHLLPHLERMGALAGGVLDELAGVADRHPPELTYRTRAGVDAQRIDKHPAYVEMERVAFAEFGLAAASHRGGVLGWDKPMPPAAKYALTYLFVQAEFGLCCPHGPQRQGGQQVGDGADAVPRGRQQARGGGRVWVFHRGLRHAICSKFILDSRRSRCCS